MISWLLMLAAVVPEGRVVLFPLEDRGAGVEAVQVATKAAENALTADGHTVSGPLDVEASSGVDLLAQARGCDYDVFCLVEVGRVLEGRQVLVGHVSGRGEGWQLRLLALDVERAALVDTVVFETPQEASALQAAASLAARRLVSTPRVLIRLKVTPSDSRVTIFGDGDWLPDHGRLEGWPGRWRFEVSAPGYAGQKFWVEVPLGPQEFDVELTLVPDPLSVPAPKELYADEPFGRPSRRTGSGVTVDELGVRTAPAPPSRFARPWPWVTLGVGVLAVVGGSLLMSDAHSSYGALANEIRYVPGATPADLAAAERTSFQNQYLTGSFVLAGGAAVAAAGLGWLLFFPDHSAATEGDPW